MFLAPTRKEASDERRGRGTEGRRALETAEAPAEEDAHNLMGGVRRYAQKYWPYNQLLPTDEPAYVSRLFYMFGSLALWTSQPSPGLDTRVHPPCSFVASPAPCASWRDSPRKG